MITATRVGSFEVVSLLDGVEDMDNPNGMMDTFRAPSEAAWDPYRALYPAVFSTTGGWRFHDRGTLGAHRRSHDPRPAFPNATYVIHRADIEWERAAAGESAEDAAVWDALLSPSKQQAS